MQGMSAQTGKPLSGAAHLAQSIRDILSTPVGTRIMRRDYGAALLDLIDAPSTEGLYIEIYAEVARALDFWEPRIDLIQVRVDSLAQGSLHLSLDYRDRVTGEESKLEGVVIS